MKTLKVFHINTDFDIADFENDCWQQAEEIEINRCWSGRFAETERYTKVKLLWNDNAFFIRFEGNQFEPLVVNLKPNTAKKTINVWERDVFEMFVAPDASNIKKYLEFEVAPTGEWLDLQMEILPSGERKSDFRFDSGMKAAARIFDNKVLAAMKISWRAFGRMPHENETWRGNLFRCVGSGANRGYLAWQPTLTDAPDFHVPEAFGKFQFVGK